MRARTLFSIPAVFLLLLSLACSKPSNESAANTATDQNAAEQDGKSGGERVGTTRREGKPAVEAVTVPAGTMITVRLGETLGSKVSSPGQSFSATVASPVEVNGKTVIPSGASASGTVVDAKPLGRFKGGAVLQVRLTSITVNGAERPVETSALTRTATGKGKRTAVMAGGGAAAGALIGGLIGGGKGAAIGALSGGGAGTAGAAFTGNKDVVLPAESAVTFKLDAPLEIR